ncbi:MAG: PDZ domain-containing protein [Betaproteobacteria bacterium]|nr:PDZ domain-containing protein [Betaproteobacteria bacterium]
MTPERAILATNSACPKRAVVLLSALFALVWLPATFAESKSKKLQLVGAIVSARGGVALVKNRDNNEIKAFKTGDSVFSIGTLLSVDRQQIILVDNDGQMTMVSNKLGGITSRTQPKVIVSNEDKHIEDGFSRIGTKIEVDTRYRDRMIREELPSILMQASSEPVVVNGEITGFRIFQFDQNSIFHKLGLKDGDIVREINGIPLTDVTKTIRFLNGLREESQLQVNVLRNGAPVSLELNVR